MKKNFIQFGLLFALVIIFVFVGVALDNCGIAKVWAWLACAASFTVGYFWKQLWNKE